MRKSYSRKNLLQPTLAVAKDLLGKYLVRRVGRKKIEAMITDVEAYVGFDDRASHASKGKTERTKVMFARGGVWYVYLVYGMYFCLNIVTENEDFPAAILIRGVAGTDGPGKVSKRFKVTKALNGRPASMKSGLWIEDRGVRVRSKDIRARKRVGIDYAGAWKEKLWRFSIAHE